MPYITDPDLLATWLTVDQAAAAYGLSARTVRRRIHAGTLAAGQVRTAKGQEWRIRPPSPAGEPPGDEAPPASGATDLMRISDVERLLAPILRDRDELQDRLEAAQAARLADREEIGRLRGRLEVLEAERDRAREAQKAAPEERADGTPETGKADTGDTLEKAAPRRRRWPWARR